MKRIIAFLLAVLLVAAMASVAVMADGEEVADEAVTVSEYEFEKASNIIRDLYPEQYATIEKYYTGTIEKLENVGAMEGVSNFLTKNSDTIITILVAFSVLAAVLYIIVSKFVIKFDAKKSTKAAETASNNAVVICRDSIKRIESNEDRIKDIVHQSEANMGRIVDYTKICLAETRNDVANKIADNNKTLVNVATSVLALSSILASMVDEMDIKPTVKNQIHAAINKANSEVKSIEEPVEKADT